MTYRHGPRSLSQAFGMLSAELAPATLLAGVQRAWPATVGEAIAAQAQPTAERGGTVTISCAASVWAQELDLMAPQIVARLNAALSGGEVRRLRCVAVGHGR
jgi:predicted nucleic acid-binding Zn ribbon protein